MSNRVEEISKAILEAMEEFAPIYGVELGEIPSEEFMMHVVASLINDGVIAKEEGDRRMSGRNAFENNAPELTPEEAMKYGDKLVVLLEEGQRYELVELSCGRIGVVKQG